MGVLLRDDGFLIALVVALAGAGLVWWCAARTSLSLPTPAVTVVAALVGLRAEHALSFSLVLGLGLLALAAWSSRSGAGFVTAGIAVLAGAVILVSSYDGLPTWIVVVVLLAMIPIVPLVELRARKWERFAPVVLLLAVVGTYGCVPDTELVRPLLAAAAVTAMLAFVPTRAVSQVGSGVVAALLLWAVGIDGAGRPGAVIGGLGCIAALALFPAIPERRPLERPWWVTAGVTVLLVLWCSRVAGLVESAWLAALLAALGFIVAIGVIAVVAGGAHLRRR